MFNLAFFSESWLIGKVHRMLSFAFERPLTSEIGTPFLNADGFGISWHTDERSNFNPTGKTSVAVGQQQSKSQTYEAYGSSDPITDPARIYDGPFLDFVVGPHPAIYKTTIAKPWVLVAFVTRNLSFFSLSGSMILFFSLCAPMFHPSPFLPTFELQASLRLRPPTTTPLFSGVTALCTTEL
jgi:hypothetical protein